MRSSQRLTEKLRQKGPTVEACRGDWRRTQAPYHRWVGQGARVGHGEFAPGHGLGTYCIGREDNFERRAQLKPARNPPALISLPAESRTPAGGAGAPTGGPCRRFDGESVRLSGENWGSLP